MEFLKIEDRLSNISADLVEYEEVFLKRLFHEPSGKWLDLTLICSGIAQIEHQLEQLRESFTGKIVVTWLDYPSSESESCYCLIMFFAEDLFWNNIAIYNKQLFLEKST
ncbi:hypothetical protein Cylst_5822 [Cylindrospermum stagnale PCC 7417]|uniref:Uncharacterized protein n=1 Tax=Cylindrospermum stagnale PCC 7417 TaxID=56107 RepID=K9X815_9NOST|nr:hypothetical protein [Cylindrospermum stagnale]AFZ27807.1 hypothetical protein Cylst_5822 [Cylindrospermum stagnale PCC 7417]